MKTYVEILHSADGEKPSIIFAFKSITDIRFGRLLSQCVDYTFKSTKKWDCDSWDSLNNSKPSGHCGFPLTNLNSIESLYCVPQ